MIATTQDQSQRLLACGVSADTADMCWYKAKSPNREGYSWMLIAENYLKRRITDEFTPAWSLSRLLELLPKRINDEYNYQKYGFKIEYSLTFNDAPWQITYKGGTLVNPEYFFDKSLIEACVKAIEWLHANGYKLNEQ